MGLRQLSDPEFLRWSNLRVVLSIGLLAAVITGLFDALVHGWAGVSLVKLVFVAVWFPLVFVGLHLYFRPKRPAPPE